MRTILLVLTLAVFGASSILPNDERESDENSETRLCKELTTIWEISKRDDSAEGTAQLRILLESPNRPSRVMAAAILYRQDTLAHWPTIVDHLAVNDYIARSDGQYNMIKFTDMLGSSAKTAIDCPSAEFKGLRLLLLFDYFKDRNEWAAMGEQKISAARFFRSSFLASLLSPHGIDAASVANKIDQAVQEQLERNTDSAKDNIGP